MALTKRPRKLAHLAAVLHGKLGQGHKLPQLTLPDFRWEQAEIDLQQLSRATQRGWQSALQSQLTSVVRSLQSLVNDLNVLQRQLEQRFTIVQPPSPHDIYLDLVALEQEFGKVEWQGRQQRLSVTTEPITLEDIYLGAFRIDLFLSDAPESQRYSIVALDPHPAAKDDSIVHPHVSGGALCEGEGKSPIRAALRSGRLLDFFQIVSNILHTYNGDGPHVSLDSWTNSVCVDCDYSIDGDSYSCSNCNCTLCSECERCCAGCSDSLCSECNASCDICGSSLCSSCRQICEGCSRGCCHDCLQPNERCNDCHAKEEVQSDAAAAAV